nr:choline dehydrogenase [Oceanococcus sp. HetDA_MAG_MS8]
MVDTIIVGAGSAGCVLANRLSADPRRQVLLLEAGPRDNNPLIHMPLGVIGLIRKNARNWGFDTTPQQHMNKRRLFWPRGKTLGGSSSINAMVYIRGHAADYDHWAELGNEGWSYADMLPIFRSLEHNERLQDSYHGDKGELNVADVRSPNLLSRLWVQAGHEAGHCINTDFNGEQLEGVGPFQVTQKNGRRWSAASAFLRPALGRPNLSVRCGVHVTRVLVEDGRAVGVELRNERGQLERLRVNDQVVLAGGAINSPQLLMLSGIGDPDELKQHNIPLVHALPGVGHNLQDHLDYILSYKSRTRAPIGMAASAVPKTMSELLRYLLTGSGQFASNVAEAGGFARSSPEAALPDLQFHFLPALIEDHGRKLVHGYGFSVHVCDLQPLSRGRITLESADPLADPRIDPQYLSNPADILKLRAGVKIVRNIVNQPALEPHRGEEIYPGPGVQSDADIDAAIRARAETVYHPVGSCRMGSDEMAVVDDKLRVHGIDGLRVADASIMPTILRGNTNAPCMAIGEKAARMILAEAKYGPKLVEKKSAHAA